MREKQHFCLQIMQTHIIFKKNKEKVLQRIGNAVECTSIGGDED